jgi:hypothetical protein
MIEECSKYDTILERRMWVFPPLWLRLKAVAKAELKLKLHGFAVHDITGLLGRGST